jgi:DNA-binding response OmpR family regulator
MTRIFVLDDQIIICVLLSRLLREAGYEVRYSHTSDALFAAMTEWPPQLVILDIYLGGEDGRSVARRLRSLSSVPILMLTGTTDMQVKLQSLDIGADDLLVKPFAHDELIARVRALLRRAAMPAQSTPAATSDLRLDRGRRALVVAGVGELLLTEAELRLLESLMSHAGKPLSRETLCKSVLRRPWHLGERSLDLHVSNLRTKLREFAPNILEIQSVRGIGYRLLITSAG